MRGRGEAPGCGRAARVRELESLLRRTCVIHQQLLDPRVGGELGLVRLLLHHSHGGAGHLQDKTGFDSVHVYTVYNVPAGQPQCRTSVSSLVCICSQDTPAGGGISGSLPPS